MLCQLDSFLTSRRKSRPLDARGEIAVPGIGSLHTVTQDWFHSGGTPQRARDPLISSAISSIRAIESTHPEADIPVDLI
jgi:hypothetical protein